LWQEAPFFSLKLIRSFVAVPVSCKLSSSKCGYLQEEQNVDFDIYVITYSEQLADKYKTKTEDVRQK